jgi:3-methylfumaryl-CoA hydratase
MNSEASVDLDHLRNWIGRTEEAEDVASPQLVQRFLATLDRAADLPEAGAEAPPAIHWCLAPAVAPMSALGQDGHPARGGFLPPVALPRRMWAGGRLEHVAPIRVGDRVRRLSRIADVALKHGRSGRLCFVTVEHEIHTPDGLAVRERQDIVYRDPSPAGQPSPAAPDQPPVKGRWQRQMTADAVMLFRYSALTFNGHRIHYDRSYATEEEGYGGLIVHGPLQATLLLHFAGELRGAPPSSFEFRGLQPLFDGALTLNADEDGKDAMLWVTDPSGRRTMAADARW